MKRNIMNKNFFMIISLIMIFSSYPMNNVVGTVYKTTCDNFYVEYYQNYTIATCFLNPKTGTVYSVSYKREVTTEEGMKCYFYASELEAEKVFKRLELRYKIQQDAKQQDN